MADIPEYLHEYIARVTAPANTGSAFSAHLFFYVEMEPFMFLEFSHSVVIFLFAISFFNCIFPLTLSKSFE